jgi:hypothetical protein
VTILFFLWFITGPELLQASNGEDPLAEAESLYKEMQYEAAVKILDSFILVNENNGEMKAKVASAYYLKAKIYFDIDEKDPNIKTNLQKVFALDAEFTAAETNHDFVIIVEAVKNEARTQAAEKVPEIVPEAAPQEAPQETKETEEQKIEKQPEQAPVKVIEKPTPKKKKKFPVLLVIGGLIAVGAVVYTILLKQKKYQLTVSIGEGVNGAPTGGVYSYKRGSNVGYSYTAQTGYGVIRVMIDGQIAPASGSINMKGNHSLNVTATKLGIVNVKSTPTGAQIIVDGANSGLLTNNTVNFTTAGSHTILLRKLGFKEDKNTLNIVLGETKTINKTLKKGLLEDFNTAAQSSILWKWKPYSSGNWSVSDGKYIANAKLKAWNYSIYDYNFAAPKYTLTIKMKRSAGNKYNSNGIILATGASPTAVSGYLFNYTTEGSVSIFEVDGYNFSADTGDFSTILNWTDSAAVNRGMGSYNTIKLVRNGADYTYYVNNQKIRSFKNAKHNPAFIYICGYNGNVSTRLEYDYVYLDIDITTESIAGEPVELIKSTQPVHIGYHKK